jgi:hypothetical protein
MISSLDTPHAATSRRRMMASMLCRRRPWRMSACAESPSTTMRHSRRGVVVTL